MGKTKRVKQKVKKTKRKGIRGKTVRRRSMSSSNTSTLTADSAGPVTPSKMTEDDIEQDLRDLFRKFSVKEIDYKRNFKKRS